MFFPEVAKQTGVMIVLSFELLATLTTTIWHTWIARQQQDEKRDSGAVDKCLSFLPLAVS